MKIESIRLNNLKGFRAAITQSIPKFCILVGANGSGKSAIFRVFEFLREALVSNLCVALIKLGGSRGLHEVRARDSADDIVIEISYRITPKHSLITYSLSIGERMGKPVVTREVLRTYLGDSEKPWRIIDFALGEGEAVAHEIDASADLTPLKREHLKLRAPDILAIRGLAQFARFPAVVALGELIEGWHVSDFRIDRARSGQEAGFAEHLSREGENLSLVAEYMYSQHREVFNEVVRKMQRHVPGLSSVQTKTTEEGRVLLRFQDGAFEDPFLARHVSDGVLKMFACLLLLHDPRPRSLLCVEHPEHQLYPKVLWELCEEFRACANRGSQVFVTTHSPEFLNAARLEEVYWLEKQDGCTTIKRAADDRQLAAFVAEGGQLGHLWTEGFFPQEGRGVRA